MAAVVGREGIHHIKGLSCDLCGEACRTDEQTDLNSLTCTYRRCPDEASVYHQDCLDKYLKKIGLERNRRTGFKCPRGSGKGTKYDVTCPGRIDKSHPIYHRNEDARQAAKASRETLPQKLSAKPAQKPCSKKAAAAPEKKSVPVPVAKPAAGKARQSAAPPQAAVAAPALAESPSDLKARVVAERQGLKYHSMTNALPIGKAVTPRSRDVRARKLPGPARQQSSLLSAMEASSVQPARKASARHGASVGGHAEAAGKGGMPLHTGPAARMAAGVAAIKNQAPVGLETEDGGDDKLTKTQRRLMRRSERRAAQRFGPEAQEGRSDDVVDVRLQQELHTLPEEEPVQPEEPHDASPSAFDDDDLEEDLDSTGLQPVCAPSHSIPFQDKAAEPVPVAIPVARTPSPQLCIPQPAPAAHDDASAEHLSPTLSQTSPENAAVGAVEPLADDVEGPELDVVQPNEALRDALVLAEARRLIQQLQHIGFPAWQAAAAVQYGGADLERGIAFLLEGALDDQAAAYRFLEAAGNQLPAIDVSGPLQQVREMATAFGLEQEMLEAAVLDANGIIEEGLARLLSDSASSSQFSSPSQSQRYPSLDSPMSSSFGQSSSLYTSQGLPSNQHSPARSGLLAASLPRPSFEQSSYESSPRIPHHSSPQHTLWSSPSAHISAPASPMYPKTGFVSKPQPMTPVQVGDYQYQQVYGFQGAPDLSPSHMAPSPLSLPPSPYHHQQSTPRESSMHGSMRTGQPFPGKPAPLGSTSPGYPFGSDPGGLGSHPGELGGTEVPQAALLAAAAVASEPDVTRIGDPMYGKAGRGQQNQDITSLVAALTCR